MVSYRGSGHRKGFRLETELLADFMPITALQSDYFVTEEGRDYDYGVGFGGIGAVRAYWGRRASLIARGRYLWMPVLSGFNGDHHQGSATFQGRMYLTRGLGVTATLTLYNRSSTYDQHAAVSADGTLFRIAGSYSFGGGR